MDGGRARPPKKVGAGRAHLVLIDESGVFLNPPVRRPWAPRGKAPVSGGEGGRRNKVSVLAAVRGSPVAQHPGRYFATRPDGSFTTPAVVGLLRGLRKPLRGKVVVVWDGGPNHTGPRSRALLRRDRRRALGRLPAYAPDLNPVEAVWSWLKDGPLANEVPEGVPAVDQAVTARLIERKSDPDLLRRVGEGADLPLPHKDQVKQGSLPASQYGPG